LLSFANSFSSAALTCLAFAIERSPDSP
jgi:hypothetical protein